MHDFFVEAWPGLADRDDVAGAFVRFVRPRLVSEAKWAAVLADDEPLLEGAAEVALEATDLKRMLAALGELDPLDREVLLARFGSPETSERVLARQMGLGQHRFRERVALALTRLSVVLGERGALSPSNAAVAQRVFVERVSIARAAGELAMAEPQVRAARRWILQALRKASMEASR